MRYEYAVSEGEKMTTNKELLDLRTANTPRGVGTQTNIFADRARNAEIWDVEGNHYIDLAAGIAVVNTGHNHPAVIAADALTEGVLLLTCGVRGNVIRFLPPLTIEPELLGTALEIVGNTIQKLSGNVARMAASHNAR
jgi:4-aminobutyrate aminotransferase-like enzyme